MMFVNHGIAIVTNEAAYQLQLMKDNVTDKAAKVFRFSNFLL